MFNKPNLFPKANETQSAKGGRVAPGNTATEGDVASRREASARPAFGGAQSPGQTQPQMGGQEASQRNELQDGESRLIVGPDVKLRGAEILDCDTLVVEGRVEATMDSRVLKIADSGAFSGKVGVDVAEIHGRFDGELTARSQLIIHGTGRVSGTIRYGKIFIEEGGQISGDIGAADAAPVANGSASSGGEERKQPARQADKTERSAETVS